VRRRYGQRFRDGVGGKPARLQLLGSFDLNYGGRSVTVAPAGQRLLTLLVLSRHVLARESVAERLWPDASGARAAGCLRSLCGGYRRRRRHWSRRPPARSGSLRASRRTSPPPRTPCDGRSPARRGPHTNRRAPSGFPRSRSPTRPSAATCCRRCGTSGSSPSASGCASCACTPLNRSVPPPVARGPGPAPLARAAPGDEPVDECRAEARVTPRWRPRAMLVPWLLILTTRSGSPSCASGGNREASPLCGLVCWSSTTSGTHRPNTPPPRVLTTSARKYDHGFASGRGSNRHRAADRRSPPGARPEAAAGLRSRTARP
jgi:hypothetical protein